MAGPKTDVKTILSPFDPEDYDFSKLPDFDNDFIVEDDFRQFQKALSAPEGSWGEDQDTNRSNFFITALNDWRPVYQKVRRGGTRKKRRKPTRRGKDETREGFVYTLLKWPLLVIVLVWIILLGALYLLTRLYIYLYEQFVTMRGQRDQLRKRLNSSKTYDEWMSAAKDMDKFLGNDAWKETDEYAYYNSETIEKVRDELQRLRTALARSRTKYKTGPHTKALVDELRALLEAAVKDNFVGVENSRLYSESYYGTKDLVQSFIDEIELSLQALNLNEQLTSQEKLSTFRHLATNYGRTALCLSGGATFAYYHFGIAKALLDNGVLPEVITGTSGGALVAALLTTRTDDELRKLLVPALAGRITACHDGFFVWFFRWLWTGARFDSIDWARRCSWFCRGSLTFKEAYERTGRILNVTCIPSDPHSPAVLANYRTAPDCVIWSAVLASAAVPGILNPVVLMRKTRDGKLAPYSFGHKWKDGSLRTDIPLKALNTHFNVNFSIVSQVNPHINLFFFSSRGTVGRPVTHRRGRGWRGGFLGSAVEQYLKLDLTKWLKVLRHLELLPRYLGQDWSEVWLQRFSGTITVWPKSRLSDFYHILSDPTPERLARLIYVGQLSAFPKLLFIKNRMKVEREIERGVAAEMDPHDKHIQDLKTLSHRLSEEDLEVLINQARQRNGDLHSPAPSRLSVPPKSPPMSPTGRAESPSVTKRLGGWWPRSRTTSPKLQREQSPEALKSRRASEDSARRSSMIAETWRQSQVFFDDPPAEGSDTDMSELDVSAAGSGRDGEEEADEWKDAVEGVDRDI